jgi:hypothetical protein
MLPLHISNKSASPSNQAMQYRPKLILLDAIAFIATASTRLDPSGLFPQTQQFGERDDTRRPCVNSRPATLNTLRNAGLSTSPSLKATYLSLRPRHSGAPRHQSPPRGVIIWVHQAQPTERSPPVLSRLKAMSFRRKKQPDSSLSWELTRADSDRAFSDNPTARRIGSTQPEILSRRELTNDLENLLRPALVNC